MDAFAFARIASHASVTVKPEDLSSAAATDVLTGLHAIMFETDERQVTTDSRYPFITPRFKGVLNEYATSVCGE